MVLTLEFIKEKTSDCYVFGFDFWDYGEVVFDKDEYTYLIEWKSENVCERITNCGDYSIASNIYENKELLED